MPKRKSPDLSVVTSSTANTRPDVLRSNDSPASVRVDPTSGMVVGVDVDLGHRVISQDISMNMAVTVGGHDERDPTGGLTYRDTEEWSLTEVYPSLQQVHRGVCVEYRRPVNFHDLDGVFHYRLFPTSPYVEVAVTFSAESSVVIRNVNLAFKLPDTLDGFLNVPGNMIRRNLPVNCLGDQPFGVSPIGGLRGSSGIIAITSTDQTSTVWPNNPTEIPDIVLRQAGEGLEVGVSMNFAADVGPENQVELLLVTLDVSPGSFEDLRAIWPAWASRYQLTSPGEPPSWMHGSGIYEAQIGTSHFWRGNSYSRYQEIRDLTADLKRIQELGFSVIQLMPRQPYPSYNVHDYDDITISYGDEQELRQLVDQCHQRGMRVILDVLLHGVLDNESIDAAVEGVKNGPLFDKLDEPVLDTFGSDISDSSNYLIAWSRHILDFSEHWRAGSPPKTLLQDSHPEWFATDSDGNVQGVYTKAFDARSPGWQRYFRKAMLELIRRTDADGFRFDAPTYNFFANWAPWARHRAFMSPLGCVPLFVDIRNDIKALKPDALMYTEPSGHLLRRSMDVNYNYDEQWLVSALLNTQNPSQRGVTNARHFMEWMEDRDSFLPVGSHTAHHIDSHDTFWWPEWGKKWRREQYSLDAVRALTAAFLAIDGPYMMFTGGEEGIEDVLTDLLGFRNRHRDLWATPVRFDTTSNASGNLLIAHRDSDRAQTVCVVNLGDVTREKVPVDLDGWTVSAQHGFNDGALDPYGFIFAEKIISS